jgi:hypothetical protein
MSLLAVLTTILGKLEKDESTNEQAIKQGVVRLQIREECSR